MQKRIFLNLLNVPLILPNSPRRMQTGTIPDSLVASLSSSLSSSESRIVDLRFNFLTCCGEGFQQMNNYQSVRSPTTLFFAF